MTGERIPRDRVRMSILVTSSAGTPHPVIIGPDYRSVSAEIVTALDDGPPPAPGVARYQIQAVTTCTKDCALVNLFDNGAILPVPLDPANTHGGDDWVSWTAQRFDVLPAPSSRSEAARIGMLRAVTQVYAIAMPLLLVLGSALFLRQAWRDARARAVRPLTFICLSMLAGVLVRLLVLALVDATSCPAISAGYAAPAYALAIGFVAFALAAAAPGRTPHGAATGQGAPSLPSA
jgi:hypothetical protein